MWKSTRHLACKYLSIKGVFFSVHNSCPQGGESLVGEPRAGIITSTTTVVCGVQKACVALSPWEPPEGLLSQGCLCPAEARMDRWPGLPTRLGSHLHPTSHNSSPSLHLPWGSVRACVHFSV